MRGARALILLTLGMVAGCNKASEPVTMTPAPAEKTRPDERATIVALGDSLSEGLGVEPGKGFPEQLQLKLNAAGYPIA